MDSMDINCLSTGSTLLIKIDNVNMIKNQFDRFLEKFVNHEKLYHDVKLPLFVVSSFSELFKHWLEFPDLQKLIGRDVFEKIFKEMANVFEAKKLSSSKQSSLDSQSSLVKDGSPSVTIPAHKNLQIPSSVKCESPSGLKSDSRPGSKSESKSGQTPPSAVSYFKLFCNFCNDNVEVVDGDPRRSYELHIRSEEHKRCRKWLKAAPDIHPPSINGSDEFLSSNAVVTTSKGCDLNSKRSDSDDFENLKPQYKLPTLYDRFCEPCCKNISTKELFVGQHLQGKSHQKQIMLYEESKKILQEYGYCFSITNKDSFEIRCHVCMKKQTGTNNFLQHCRTLEHQENLREIEKGTKRPKYLQETGSDHQINPVETS